MRICFIGEQQADKTTFVNKEVVELKQIIKR